MPLFEAGTVVRLSAAPDRKGAVLSAACTGAECRYQIFIDGQVQTFYESQLIADAVKPAQLREVTLDEFKLLLTALQINHPSSSTLYSLNAARIDFIPYQFRPALKFIRSERPRLLIADGVGVGKTIEAGLILREMQARTNVQSVLIICPRPLVTERKWEQEMKRFDERFIALDGPTLRHCISETDLDGKWPTEYQKAILPYSLLDEALLLGQPGRRTRRRLKGLLDLDPPPRFDLVIVDEAHHIRNPETNAHQAASFFCEHAESAVFLTATPVQLGSQDLFSLLHVLRPDLIIDWESYQSMAAPNPFINRAVSQVRTGDEDWHTQADNALEDASQTAWGQAVLCLDPEFHACREMLHRADLIREQRVELIRRIEDLHTFSGIINRTRRRDIGEFTIRKPETVSIPFTPPQQTLHDELMAVQSRILEMLHGDANVKFMMTTLRRQAASCMFGLVPFIEDILTRRLDDLSWLAASDSDVRPEDDALEVLGQEIDSVVQKARALSPEDPKLDVLLRLVAEKQRLANNKMIVFSTFRHTLSYLYLRLRSVGYRVGLIHGSVPDEDTGDQEGRRSIRDRFEAPRDLEDALDILIFSEVGCEGLDYQFCDCIVNYDIPWNPMRIEQRIGRIDRVGQQSESVAIYNFITPGTVEAEIYKRCLLRIGVFNESLGESEVILGEITQKVRGIVENLSLSPEDRAQKLEQLADNEVRLIQEQRRLEDKEAEFFGIRLPKEMTRKDIEEATSIWLGPEAIHRLVLCYLERTCGERREYVLGEKPLKTMRLSQEARARLLEDYQKIPKQTSPMFRDWEHWLKGSEPHLSVTFDADCARRNRDVAFIMPLHPLAIQAAQYFHGEESLWTTMAAHDTALPDGHYPFAVYAWEYCGLRNDLDICCVSLMPELTAALPGLLPKAVICDVPTSDPPDEQARNNLDAVHHRLWSESRKAHRQRTETAARARRESLATSHNARIALLREQLSKATNDKIRRMRQSQIDSAEADGARRMNELNGAGDKADILARPISFGIMVITRS